MHARGFSLPLSGTGFLGQHIGLNGSFDLAAEQRYWADLLRHSQQGVGLHRLRKRLRIGRQKQAFVGNLGRTDGRRDQKGERRGNPLRPTGVEGRPSPRPKLSKQNVWHPKAAHIFARAESVGDNVSRMSATKAIMP